MHHEGDGLTGEGGGIGNVQLSVLRMSMSNFWLILILIKLPKSSVANPDSMGSLDPDPDPEGQKLPQKNRK